MHHWLEVLALIALSFTADALASPQEDVDRVEDARYDALIRGDGIALAATLADEFLYYQPSGKTATKASYIELTRSGAVKIYKTERYDVKIHVYGDVATVMGSTRLDIQFGDDRRDVDLRYLNVGCCAMAAGSLPRASRHSRPSNCKVGTHFALASAWSISHRMSSMSSMPMDKRIMSGVTPALICSSSDNWRCVVDAG